MKAKGTHEGCIEQIRRLFATQLYNGSASPSTKPAACESTTGKCAPTCRRPSPQSGCRSRPENLEAITDIAGYREEFLKLFGFGLPGIDYNADVEPHILMP